jgi:hypothetical protein
MPEIPARVRSFLSTADKGLAYSLCGALAGIPVFFLIYAFVKGETEVTGLFISLFLSVAILAFGAMFFVDTSELHVSDIGLARRICGRVCMQIPWTGIKSIRETFRPKARNGPQIIIQITPIFRRGVVFHFRRMIVISDQIERFDELVEILNARINQYSIRVEINSNGVWTQRSKLEARQAGS